MSKWMPYPENQPEQDGRYLVTINHWVGECEFKNYAKQYDSNGIKYFGPAWIDENCGGFHYDVKAFMNLPEAYKNE